MKSNILKLTIIALVFMITLGDDTNQLYGPGNLVVFGTGNVAQGQDNTFSGYNNLAVGDQNTFTGNYNIVQGKVNDVSGDTNQIGGYVNSVNGSQNTV